MTDQTERPAYDVDVGVGRNLGAKLRVSPEAGENDVAVVEHVLPAGKLAAPLHRHSREDEISYVLEGRMGVREGEAVGAVEAGEVRVKRRGVWHTFWNPGPDRLRFLEIITPGAFAWYFAEADEILPGTGEPDEAAAARLADLHEAYGFEMRPESVPELIDRHGLEP
jgi:mannose-6-phosphate isomerase-like protein (cupin superfamily)